MRLKNILGFSLMVLVLTTHAKSLEKAVSLDKGGSQMQKNEPPPPLPPIPNNNLSKRDYSLQHLQGDWLCRGTFNFEDDEIKIDVVKFEYQNIQNHFWRAQAHDYITISLLVDKKWITGEAQVIERSQSLIHKIEGDMIYEQLIGLDIADWISYDENLAGQYIRNVFFAEADRFTRKLMAAQTLRQYRIDQLSDQSFQYMTFDFTPATETSCHRLNLMH